MNSLSIRQIAAREFSKVFFPVPEYRSLTPKEEKRVLKRLITVATAFKIINDGNLHCYPELQQHFGFCTGILPALIFHFSAQIAVGKGFSGQQPKLSLIKPKAILTKKDIQIFIGMHEKCVKISKFYSNRGLHVA